MDIFISFLYFSITILNVGILLILAIIIFSALLITKNQKKIPKKSAELNVGVGNVKINLNKFSELVEKITKQNSFRPYPDINDIPN